MVECEGPNKDLMIILLFYIAVIIHLGLDRIQRRALFIHVVYKEYFPRWCHTCHKEHLPETPVVVSV